MDVGTRVPTRLALLPGGRRRRLLGAGRAEELELRTGMMGFFFCFDSEGDYSGDLLALSGCWAE